MSIKMYYRENDVFTEISSGDDVTSPATTTHNGKEGDAKGLCLYIRNDDASKWYSNIIIKPVDLEDANPYGDIAYDETGWGVKLSSGGEEPTESEWASVAWGKMIYMSDIGSDTGADTTTYFPFWYYISCPPNSNAQNKLDIVLDVEFTENAVIE